MSRLASSTAHARAADPRAGRTHSLVWRAGWLMALAGAGLALAYSPLGLSEDAAIALAVAAAPALLGLVTPRNGPWPTIGLIGWAICGALACVLTGGVSGPLAAWCLAPVAAAAMARRAGARGLAEGASLSIMAAALAAVAELAGLAFAPPPPQQAFWLALLALATAALGVGAGLILNNREAARGAAMKAREARALTRLLNAQPFLTLVATPFGKVRYAWGAAIDGARPEDLLDGGLEAVARPEDAGILREALAEVVRDGAAEAVFVPRSALDRAIAVRLRRLGDDQVLIVLRDVTVEAAREADLEQQRGEADRRAAGRTRFLANMSHELRTPLNAIMGFSDIMRARMFGPLSDRYGEYADLIHESGRHLLDLISDLLDMSKIEAERYQLDRELFDAREAVTAGLRLMRLQADGAGVSLRGVLPPQAIEIDADRRAIKQIVLNLVSNALKFTPKGGSVTVTAQLWHGQFELVVADTGVGISAEDLARLGRPFEQAGDSERRALGSGLGLSLVRAFAELHGGEMLLESRSGAGTTVTVRLPAQPAESMPEPAYPPLAPTAGNVIPFTPQR